MMGLESDIGVDNGVNNTINTTTTSDNTSSTTTDLDKTEEIARINMEADKYRMEADKYRMETMKNNIEIKRVKVEIAKKEFELEQIKFSDIAKKFEIINNNDTSAKTFTNVSPEISKTEEAPILLTDTLVSKRSMHLLNNLDLELANANNLIIYHGEFCPAHVKQVLSIMHMEQWFFRSVTLLTIITILYIIYYLKYKSSIHFWPPIKDTDLNSVPSNTNKYIRIVILGIITCFSIFFIISTYELIQEMFYLFNNHTPWYHGQYLDMLLKVAEEYWNKYPSMISEADKEIAREKLYNTQETMMELGIVKTKYSN
ncbi:unnamed protein product (mitochondrion) [Parajaminaea phylloscopi]|uniref:Uncharacterized protein n=1 Tax=Parajaminaea phylloscopi TaxID=1463510 RepID=A0AB39A6Z7_9BASI